MGYDCSYECTKATIVEDMGTNPTNGEQIVLVDLEFENEHGHEMMPIRAVVALRKLGGIGWVTIVTEPEDVLGTPDEQNEASWDAWDAMEPSGKLLYDRLLAGDVGFDIHNGAEIATELQKQLE